MSSRQCVKVCSDPAREQVCQSLSSSSSCSNSSVTGCTGATSQVGSSLHLVQESLHLTTVHLTWLSLPLTLATSQVFIINSPASWIYTSPANSLKRQAISNFDNCQICCVHPLHHELSQRWRQNSISVEICHQLSQQSASLHMHRWDISPTSTHPEAPTIVERLF